jgi:hypothetical protein
VNLGVNKVKSGEYNLGGDEQKQQRQRTEEDDVKCKGEQEQRQ